jgi:hypothetical protein
MEMLALLTLLVGMAGTVRAIKCGASQKARAATTGRDACPTIFRFLTRCGIPFGHLIDTL